MQVYDKEHVGNGQRDTRQLIRDPQEITIENCFTIPGSDQGSSDPKFFNRLIE